MKQQQQLSPQQIMLMRLLQLPITSLEQAIQEAVESNPLLEMGEREDDNLEIGEQEEENIETSENESETENESIDAADEYDEYDDYERQERDPNEHARECLLSATESCLDRLLKQLHSEALSERDWIIGQELIGSLDNAGYLSRSLELVSNDLAFRQGIDATPTEIEAVLLKIQTLDPPGIGARNLQECLSLQLHREEQPDVLHQYATAIIDHCWEDFSNKRYDRIKNQLHIDDATLEEAADIIRHLDPKPASSEDSGSQAHYILPDFIVSLQDGKLELSLYRGHLPELHLNEEYMGMLQTLQKQRKLARPEQETLKFLKGKSEEAQCFIDTLQTRDRTMIQIMTAIMAAQKTFFISGNKSDLRPLQQKDIATLTGYDISTVSRMVNSKYVQTDFGTISLKECFSSALSTEDGEEVATEKIRQALQEIVDEEDKTAPLTDDELASELEKKGFPVARRTVSKYREQLGIPIGRLRKGLKILIVALLLSTGLGSAGNHCWAQVPMSYYDSLIYQQTHSPKVPKQNSEPKKEKNEKESAKSNKRGNLQKPLTPAKSVLDSILNEGDELIDQIYNESLPSPLWYGNEFSGQRVRLRSFNSDSLPDEVNIRLVKEDNEFCFPVKNIITSPYGWRWNRAHRGVDVRLKTGDAVHCAFDGVVRIARPMGAYGNLVVVRHYNGLETVYGHLSKIEVTAKQKVKAGDVLGLGGSTGRSTGPHLHFEVRFQYEPFDPEWILDFSSYTLRTHKLHLDKSYFGIRKPREGEELTYKADKSYVKEQERVVKKDRYYTTVDGDYSELIALRFGISVQKLRDMNPGLKKVKPGMRLKVR